VKWVVEEIYILLKFNNVVNESLTGTLRKLCKIT